MRHSTTIALLAAAAAVLCGGAQPASAAAGGDATNADAAVSVASCTYRKQTKVHCCNPNMFYAREYRSIGGRCRWTPWKSQTFAKKPFPLAVRVRGRWYENKRSNRFYVGYGKWRVRNPRPNASDPTVEMVAGRWYPKLNKGGYYKAPNGRFYKSKTSSTVWRGGRWVKEKRRPHPTNPKLWWVAGQWQQRPASAMPGYKHYVQRAGRWWKGPPSMKPQCFFFYRRGRWIRTRQLRAFRNNPHFRYTHNGTFVRRSRMATRRLVRRRGRWYRSRTSPFYYRNLKWVRESPRNRDPRWRRSRGTWVRRNLAAVPGSSKWVRAGPATWFRDSTRREKWSYGRWRPVHRSAAQRSALRARRRREALLSLAGPVDLRSIVSRASEAYYGRFLRWFLRDYLRATAEPARPRPPAKLSALSPEPGPSTSAADPEPAPPAADGAGGASSSAPAAVDLGVRNPWEEGRARLTRAQRRSLVSPEELARDAEARARENGARSAAVIAQVRGHWLENRRPNAGLDRDDAAANDEKY